MSATGVSQRGGSENSFAHICLCGQLGPNKSLLDTEMGVGLQSI